MSVEERLKVLVEAKPNTWLALSSDEQRVIASAESFGEAARLAAERGEHDPVITFIPPTWGPMVL